MSDRFVIKRDVTIHPIIENRHEEKIFSTFPETQSTEWIESEKPLAFFNMHFLEQVEAKGKYRKDPPSSISRAIHSSNSQVNTMHKKKIMLHMTVSILDILNVDPQNECFTVKYRTYMLWETDIHDLGLSEYAEKAIDIGHYYPLNRLEVQHFAENCHLPKVVLFNQILTTETDVLDIRVYGGEKGKTAVMTNQSFVSVCRDHFKLHHFPFDLQFLRLDFKLNDARTWNAFHLSINAVQFYQDTFYQQEWYLLVPKLKRGPESVSGCNILIPIQRKSSFYTQNVIMILLILSLLGLTTFAFPTDQLAGRTFVTLTLILTLVAFKFSTVTGSLPKVPYSTLMDRYMSSTIWIQAILTVLTIIPNSFQDDNRTDTTINFVLSMFSIGFIVINFGVLAVISIITLRGHYRDNHLIPLEKDRPWYSFRFSSPKFLVDLNPNMSLSDSFRRQAAMKDTNHFKSE